VNSTVKTIIFWVIILACLVLLWSVVQKNTGMGKDKEVTFSQFLTESQAGQVNDVTVVNSEVHGHYKNDAKEQFHTTVPANYPDMYKILQENKVNTTIKDTSGNGWVNILIQFSPILVLGLLWFFMLRQMQSGGNKALSFGKSRARLLSMQQKKVTFKDVAGVDEAKEELKEIIEFLREAQKFQKLGGRIPKGVLLSDLREQAKLCSPAQLPAKPMCPSSPSQVLTLLRCSLAWAQAAFATCSNKARRMLRASSSSTKSMRSDAIAAPVSVVDTMSVSRP